MILHRSDQTGLIRALRSAAPYIRLYKGKTFVIKAGGAVFGDAAMTRALIEQIAILHHLGVRVVLVHGGGPQLTQLTEALGVPTRMVQGRRITDEKSIDATSMVLNGLINTRILALCRDLEINAVGLSGVDAGLVRAHLLTAVIDRKNLTPHRLGERLFRPGLRARRERQHKRERDEQIFTQRRANVPQTGLHFSFVLPRGCRPSRGRAPLLLAYGQAPVLSTTLRQRLGR